MSLVFTTLLLTAHGWHSVPPAQSSDSTAQITITAHGLNDDGGRLLALLYDGPEGFPKNQDACADWRSAEITDGRATTSFSNLAPGTYAVLVVHDADRDGYLDTNLLGMPKEGVGVSNNGGGIPKFNKASFEVAVGAVITKRIQVRYL